MSGLATSEPTVTCKLCGRRNIVRPDGRGHPVDIAERRLKRECKAAGCACDPQYRAGVSDGLLRELRKRGVSPDEEAHRG